MATKSKRTPYHTYAPKELLISARTNLDSFIDETQESISHNNKLLQELEFLRGLVNKELVKQNSDKAMKKKKK